MPELPDLVYVEARLRAEIIGKRIEQAETGDPIVLRLMTSEPFPEVLVGRRIVTVRRRGQFMQFELEDALFLVVNCMLTGRFVLSPPEPEGSTTEAAKRPAALALRLNLDDRRTLSYVDEKRMGKVYVAGAAALDTIPQLGKLGIEILSDAFTEDAFQKLLRKRRDQVRNFLMDKAALASVGNAYADEILFAAKIHPKTFCPKLTPDDRHALYEAVGRVMREAVDEVSRRGAPIEVKVRDFLAVRGRVGKPCRVCGTTIRAVRVGDGDACFCPRCQPTDRKLFIDWSKLPDR